MILNTVIGLMGGYDKDAQLYFNQLTVQPSVAFKSAVNTLVLQLKLDGNWSKLDRFFLFATELQQHARVSLVNPSSTQASEVNSPGWASNLGYVGAATRYLNLNFAQNTLVQFTQNSSSHGVYCLTASLATSAEHGIYLGGVSNDCSLFSRWTDGICYIGTNGAGGESFKAVASSLGMNVGYRLSSSAHGIYKNGVDLGTNNLASAPLSGFNWFALAMNQSGSPQRYSTRRVALSFMGSGTINQTTLYSAFQAFATTRGFNV